jgi:queuosine biosynthesis protein QueD
MTVATLRTDGGSRGNPGPAGAGFVIERDGTTLADGGRFLGETTNNVAEYEALIWGLENALALGLAEISVLSDSLLLVRQMNGDYRVKHANLKPLFLRALELRRQFRTFSIQHVYREDNTAADALANEAMDARADVGHPALAGDATPEPLSLFAELAVEADPNSVETSDTAHGKGSSVYELTVKGHFDAAHAIRDYPGECRELHGHTWDVEATVVGAKLDEIGIVYDFKQLKADLASILERYDHKLMNDVAPFDVLNTTAENLARVVFEELETLVGDQVRVAEVAVWESPVAKVTYRPG